MPLVKRDRAAAEEVVDDGRTLTALLDDLGSTDHELRRSAARRLGEFPEAAAILCSAACVEARETVREAIFTALIRIGTKAAAAGLVPLLQSEDAGLRNGAIEALKTMPDTAAECIGEIFASSTDVRIFGVEILGALAHPEAPRWLVRVIEEDPELNVCAAAVDALVECGDHQAIPALLRLLDRFPNEPFLEFSVQTALTRIASV